MLRAVIVDDEKPAREELESLLAAIPEIVVMESCGNAFQAIRAVKSHRNCWESSAGRS